jgi:hypothetical protein
MSDEIDMATRVHEYMLEMRGVEEACETCRGSGVRSYGSTATWRGGIGGMAITQDTCDSCWGSGDKHKPGANLRHVLATIDQKAAEKALSTLSTGIGLDVPSLAPARDLLCDEIEALATSKPRTVRPTGFRELARALARRLRGGEKKEPTGADKA